MFGRGAFFLFFGPPTLAAVVTNIRAKFPTAGLKVETVFTFIIKREAFMAANFLNPQNSYSLGRRTFKFIIRPSGLNSRSTVLQFWA